MDEEEIRSSLEIALEKVSKMPALTPQQIRAQKTREYKSRSEVVVGKYLTAALRAEDLVTELAGCGGDQ